MKLLVLCQCNMMSLCAQDGPLGTTKKRTAYVRKEFPLVNPIVLFCFFVEKGKKTTTNKKTLAYVPPCYNAPEAAEQNWCFRQCFVRKSSCTAGIYILCSTLMKILFLQAMNSQLLLPFTLTTLKQQILSERQNWNIKSAQCIGSYQTYLHNKGPPPTQYSWLSDAIPQQLKSAVMQKFCISHLRSEDTGAKWCLHRLVQDSWSALRLTSYADSVLQAVQMHSSKRYVLDSFSSKTTTLMIDKCRLWERTQHWLRRMVWKPLSKNKCFS